MRRLSRLVLTGLISVTALACAPEASANIVIGQSIDGVELGASEAQVRQVLGTPLKREEDNFFYPESVGLRIGFQQSRVAGVLSISKQQKTSKGITIGSSRSQFKRAYPRANCLEGPYGPQSLYCAVTARFNGRESYTSSSLVWPSAVSRR